MPNSSQPPYVGEEAIKRVLTHMNNLRSADQYLHDHMIDNSTLGKPGGVATLDENGKIPIDEIPDYENPEEENIDIDFSNYFT